MLEGDGRSRGVEARSHGEAVAVAVEQTVYYAFARDPAANSRYVVTASREAVRRSRGADARGEGDARGGRDA